MITYLTAFSIHRLVLLEALFLRRALRDLHLSKAGSETLSPQFFPRRKRGSSRALRSKKLLRQGPALRCGQEVQVRFGR
jgi:hypothetical protein